MWQYDFHESQATDGLIRPEGNLRTIFEKRKAPLCFTQKYYSPNMWGEDRVLNEAQRLTAAMSADRGSEALIFGARRWREVRSLRVEHPDKIAAANKREDEAHAERIRRTGGEKVRWWHTRHALSQRDSLKTVKMSNFTFNPERLVSCKEVVILNLTGCRLGDQQLVWVSTFMQQNNTLRRLILQGNDITAKGVEQLAPGIADSPSLIELDLAMNLIGDQGLANLCVAFSANIRKTVISKICLGACGLTPNATYHLVRMLRDFPTMQCLLLWRNNFGSSGNQYSGPDITKRLAAASGTVVDDGGKGAAAAAAGDDMAGIGVLLEELRVNKNVRLVDLTSTNLSEGPLGQFATDLERQAREKRIAEVEHRHRAQRIIEMSDEIERRRGEAVFDDEKYAVIALERELEAERAKFQEQLEHEEREKKRKTAFAIWRDRVMGATGKELIEMKRHVRLVLRFNPSVTPSTIKRLGAFFDVRDRPDYEEFLARPRIYDNVIVPRRRPMEKGYTFREPLSDYASAESKQWYDPFQFEDEFDREQRLDRERKRQELLEMQRRGYDGAGTRYSGAGDGGSSPGRQGGTSATVLIDEDEIVEQNLAYVSMVEGFGLGEQAKRARKIGAQSVGHEGPSAAAIAARLAAAAGTSRTDEALTTLEMQVDLEATNTRNRLTQRFEDAMAYLRDHQVRPIDLEALPKVGAGLMQADGASAPAGAELFADLAGLALSIKRLERLIASGAPEDAVVESDAFVASEKARITAAIAAFAANAAAADTGAAAAAASGQQQQQQLQGFLKPATEAQKSLCVGLIEELLRQPADVPGNLQLAQVLMQAAQIDWRQQIHERQLLGGAAALGNVYFFHLFLYFADGEGGRVGGMDQLLALCSSHPTHRVPLCQLLVQRFGPLLALQRPMLQELLEDVASLRRELPDEVRGSNRQELLHALLATPELGLSVCAAPPGALPEGTTDPAVGNDGLDVFQRACFEGDAGLLQLLVQTGRVTSFRSAAVTDAQLTPLMLAAFSDSFDCVAYLLDAGGDTLDSAAASRFGDNALDVAQSNKRRPEIVNLLRDKAGLTSKHDERIREAEAQAEASRKAREEEAASAAQHRIARGARAEMARQQAQARR